MVKFADRYVAAIYDELSKHKKLGFNELQRTMVEEKKLMTSKTFQAKMKNMVDNRLIFRNPEEGSQRVWYSTKSDEFELERDIVADFERRFKNLEEQCISVDNKLTRMQSFEQASAIGRLFEILALVEYRLYVFRAMFKENPKLRKMSAEVEKFRGRIFHLVHSRTSYPDVLSLITRIMDVQEVTSRKVLDLYIEGKVHVEWSSS